MFVFPPCFNAGDTIYFPFDSYDSNGASVTITGLAVTDIEVYKNGSVTQRSSDNGYALLDTDGIDFDSVTGLHGFSIDTSDNSDSGFWADGSQYWVNVNAVTIDSQTVRFTYFLPLGLSLRPTTAGRKLDVSSGGEAGLDWANIGSPTTTVGLSGTTVKTATDVETDTADIQSRIPAALGANGNIKADVRDYNGVAGTFAFGKPAVNTTDWNGTAISSEIPTTLISVGTGTGQLQISSGVVQSNAVQFSGSATAANNAEIVFDTDFATNYNTTRDAWVTNVQDTAGSGNLPANVKAISDDATAADNAEAFFDGTGYAGTNNVIPTVTTTTNLTNAPTSGDLTATMKASVNSEVDTAISDAALATATNLALVKAVTDALTSAAAAKLALSAGQIVTGTVDTVTNTHTPTTTEFQADDITEATADHYNGRIIIFTTGALTGQATSISDYAAVGGIGQFTVVGMTEAPANNDTFVIV